MKTKNDAPELFAQLEGEEILSQRDEHTKVYDLGLGRRQAITFAAPVHYKDAAGNWHDIDNTLETVEDATGHSFLRNRANAIQMEFDRKRGAVRIAHEGRSLSWKLLNSVEVEPAVMSGSDLKKQRLARANMAEASTETAQERRMNRGHKLNVQVDYANARPGLSLRYSITGARMKEDIILENAAAASDAAIVLPDEYSYTVDDKMRVLVSDKETDATLYIFEAPVTYDAAGKETTATVTLEPTDDGVVMRYIVDAQFLADAQYPVTIDPVISTPTKKEIVQDAYVYEKYPTRNFGSVYLMRSGTLEGNYSLSMIRFDKLPKIKASDTIISAQLRMHAESHGSSSEYMGCFPILRSWKDTEVTWNSIGASDLVNNDYISRDLLAYVTGTSGFRYFDITPIYRDWYRANADGSSANYGVAIHCPEGINDSGDYVEWTATQYSSDNAPCVIVDYVSHAGRQSWWQYESMAAGRAGTAYVDIFNGNLVFEHGDGGTTGSRMPVGLTHVYNSCLSESNPVGCGMGWRTTMHQSVNKRTLSSKKYYVWTDGSATEHYFLISGSQPYSDEEGMGLKLSTSGSVLTITDKGHNRMEFALPSDETQKPLNKVYDSLNNTATLTYNASGLLTKITDGVNRSITLAYNSSNLLTTMTIPGRPTLTFSYTGSNLTGIRYSDVSSGGTTFTYESGSNLLTCAKNYDGNQVDIGYEAAGYYCESAVDNYAQQVRRVISIEQRNGSTRGAKELLQYLHMTTKVTAVSSTDDNTGKTITYQFNSAGNVTCCYDELGYAQSNTYSSTVANQLTSASKLQKVVINRLTNIDFSSGWTTSKGSTADTAAQDTATRCLNMPSVKITKAGSGETSHRLSVSVPTAGKYTFSAYVKNASALSSGALFVRIRSGSSVYASRTVTGATAAFNTDSAADGWDRVYVSAQLPAGTVSVELVDTAPSGSAWFACPQLETGSIPNHVNLLLNADFTRTFARDAQTFATDWSVSTGISTNAANGIVLHSAAGLPSGLSGNALRIHSYANTNKSSHCQSVYVKGNKGDVFVIGGWLNATSVYSGDDKNHFKPCIISRFKDTSGNWSAWQYNEYDVQRVGWTFAQWAIVAPSNYTEFRIGIQYARNNGTAMFSNVFVHREEFGQSFAYDDKKNVVSVASLSTQKSGMEYDDADNLKAYRQPGADSTVKYTMDYGSTAAERKKHLLRTSTTPMGVRDSYTYDDHGNCLTSVRQKSGTTPFMRTETAYDADGNYPASQKDARGYSTTQSVNATDGTLTSVTDPKGQNVSYTYDASKRVTGVQATANNQTYKNAYTYEKDRIKTVSHNTTTDTPDVTYTFGYDALGRKTTVKVGDQTLSTNSYTSDRSGLLEKVQYGNGGQVAYFYDGFNRLTGIRHDGESSNRYSYEYGANGQASILRDSALNRVFQTEHDLCGRPMGTQLRNASGSLIYRTEFDYDKQNRLVGFGETTGNGSHKTTYVYDDDNRPKELDFDGTAHKLTYTYDSLGRIQQRSAVNGSTVNTNYTYVAGGHGTGSTTPLVESITQGSLTLSYKYDNRGNITSETRNGKTILYAYDSLGQLFRVDDSHENICWCYYYDRGGNITEHAKFNLGDVSWVHSYKFQYRTSGWKDVLTSYDGTSLTHDAIGNLTNDGTWTYTWQAGRQLKQMSKSGTTVQFQYDHNGLRTKKTVTSGGATTNTEYILNGKQIACMTQGTNKLHFFYDAQGRPAMVNYNGVFYTYAHNLQGDIIAILDNTGAIIVEYYYDAWGRQYKVTGSMKDTLGKLNPFRYRGYVYDEETGLYYLRSRYYNPTWGRFINADSYIGKISMLGQHNQFSYCANVPIRLFDETGQSFLSGLKRFGEQLAYNYLYSSQIKFWNAICLGLYGIGCKYSAELLDHSLQPKPATVSYSNNSSLAEKIKNDSEFKEVMADIIKNQTFNVETSMSFNSDFDLFGALHSVSMIVSPVTINGRDMYHVSMTDTYDFKYENDHSSQSSSFWKKAMKAGAIAGNNLAYLDMNRGAINEYEIVIDFYVD